MVAGEMTCGSGDMGVRAGGIRRVPTGYNDRPVTGVAYTQGVLTCDGLSLWDLAKSTGTPVHVYSGGVIAERFSAFDAPFAGTPHRLHYAIKANSTLGIVSRLRALGAL